MCFQITCDTKQPINSGCPILDNCEKRQLLLAFVRGFCICLSVFCFCFSRWQWQEEKMVIIAKVAELSPHSQKCSHSVQCCASLQAQGCWSWVAGNHWGEFHWIWAKVIHFVLLRKSCSQCSAWVTPERSVMPWSLLPRSALLQTCSTGWAGYRKGNTCLCLVGHWTNIIIFKEI